MPRFVLLYHDCPPEFGKPSHWDFMLEHDGALLTWSLAELPTAWRREAGESSAILSAVPATRLADHRLAYLDFEGPMSGNRGRVTRLDGGDYRVLEEVEGRLCVELCGGLVRGTATLTHEAADWRLECGRQRTGEGPHC
jgi:hypothetical protein